MSDQKSAVVIVNLGTPDAPTTSAVRRYLKQFLADPRVVETPRLIWFFVLRLIILPMRPARVARAYQSVWQEDSPIRLITLRQALGLEQRLSIPVRAAMTYGEPALPAVLDKLCAEGVEHIHLLPLYPQYSGSTAGAVADALANWIKKQRELPSFSMTRDYWQEDAWQQAVADSVQAYRKEHGEAQKLLFSFHGIPQSYQERGDLYGPRCLRSAEQIALKLGLKADQWQACFQSRFGPQPWLQPYTDKTLEEWGAQGVESVQVVCPGFSADCLETLEEIDDENRHLFIAAGGKEYSYIPALNDSAEHLDALAAICQKVLPR